MKRTAKQKETNKAGRQKTAKKKAVRAIDLIIAGAKELVKAEQAYRGREPKRKRF